MRLPTWILAAVDGRVHEAEMVRDIAREDARRLRDELTEARELVNGLQRALQQATEKHDHDDVWIRDVLALERREHSDVLKRLRADLALANARTEFVDLVRAAVARQEVIDAIRAQPPAVDNPIPLTA